MPLVRPTLSLPPVIVLMLLCGGCSRWLYPVDERAADVEVVPIGEGWNIALHHFPPTPGATARHTPVLLCHGITGNRLNWDLSERLSLPRFLAARGFDVFLLELRGSGAAGRPGLLGGPAYDYTLDDYARTDVPAAIARVRARTGATQVQWVGHSMGGIVMYLYLELSGGGAVRSLVAVGSPPYVLVQSRTLADAIELYPVLDFFFDALPVGAVSELGAPFAWPSRLPAQHIVWNDANLDPAASRSLAANGTHAISTRVVAQMADATDGHLRSADGQIDYTEGLASITTPILFVAGALDHLAPPAALYEGYRRVASTDKRIEVLSRANGYRADYGHVDLALGEASPDEVYPLVAAWLVAHD